MKRTVRFLVAILVLTLSISLLVWAYRPNPRETRIQPVSPAEMQLPTPASFRVDPQPAA